MTPNILGDHLNFVNFPQCNKRFGKAVKISYYNNNINKIINCATAVEDKLVCVYKTAKAYKILYCFQNKCHDTAITFLA